MYQCLARVRAFERKGFNHADMTKGDAFIVHKALQKQLAREGAPAPLVKRRRDVPQHLSDIVMHLLAKDPAERFYPNARAVLNALAFKDPQKFGAKGAAAGSYLLPIGDRHIGNSAVRERLNAALRKIYEKAQPEEAVFWIEGAKGLGKTHLLKKLREAASQHAEAVNICQISFPADTARFEAWWSSLQAGLSENAGALVVLVDNIDQAMADDARQKGLKGLIEAATARHLNRALFAGMKPMIVVATSVTPPAKIGHVTSLKLEPFAKAEIAEYLKSTPALEGREIPEKLVDRLYFVTSGVPAELARTLSEMDSQGAVFSPEGQIIVPLAEEPSVNLGTLPATATTRDRVAAAYGALDALEKEIVNVLAVWNHKGIARQATEADVLSLFYSPSVKQALANLVAKGVLEYGLSVLSAGVAGGGMGGVTGGAAGEPLARDRYADRDGPGDSRRLAFVNPFMQAGVYELIPADERRVLHDTLAMCHSKDSLAALLHRAYGSDRQKGIRSLVLLAKKCLAGGHVHLAAELLAEAKGRHLHSPRLEGYVDLLQIESKQLEGKFTDGEKLFSEAVRRQGLPSVLKVELLAKGARCLLAERRLLEARGLIAMALLDVAVSAATPLKLALLNYEARSYYDESFIKGDSSLGLKRRAEELYLKSRAMEKILPKHALDRVLNNDIADVWFALGKSGEAIKAYDEALQRAEKAGHIFNMLTIMQGAAQCCLAGGEYKKALKMGDRILGLAKRTDEPRWLAQANRINAVAHYYMRDYRRAAEFDGRCLALLSCLGDSPERDQMLKSLYVRRGHCMKELKDYDGAIINFETAIGRGVTGLLLASAYEGIGESHFLKKDGEKAIIYLEMAEGLLNGKELAGTTLAVQYLAHIAEMKKRVEKISP
jgi:tetratricopeptide (TPR) repeat protein